jgi:predicted MFS family arabinose efflux permease
MRLWQAVASSGLLMPLVRLAQTLTPDQRWIYVCYLLTGFGVSLFWYLQPLYLTSLGASPEQIGLALAVSGLIVTVLYIPIGLWTDRRGRKPVIVWGWGLGAAATLALALAPDWRWFIPAYAAYLLSNFAVPPLQGYVAAAESSREVAHKFAILATGSSIGSVLAPVVGGWIGEHWGLRAVYLTAAVIFGLATLALAQLSDQPVAPHETARANARGLLVSRPFLAQIGFTVAVFFTLELGQVMMPKFLEDVRGLHLGQIGWLGTLASVGIVLLTLWLGQMPADRPRPLLLSQAAALAALVLLLASPALVAVGLAYFIHGGNRVIRPLVMGRLAALLDASTVGFGFGVHQTALQFAITAAPYLAGLLYARDPAWPLLGGIAGLAVTMLLTLFLPRRR